MPRKAVRLADVAAAAGVSVSTVSKILKGDGRASAATRARVLETARRLDFRPNPLAQSFVTGRSLVVGVLAENAPSTFSMPVIIGAQSSLGRADLAALMYDARNDPKARTEALRKLQARRVDGLIVIGEGPDIDYPPVPADFDVPTVYTYTSYRDPRVVSYTVDNVAIGQMAARHLIELGRTRIAHVAAGRSLRSTIDRHEGFATTLADAGLPLVFSGPLYGDWKRTWGSEAARIILGSGTQVDAIFAASDDIAVGLYATLRGGGVRIPDDIALIGVDNYAKVPGRGDRFLTTIDRRLPQLGSSAADHLIRLIGGSTESGGAFPTASELIVGATTRPDLVGPVEQEIDTYLTDAVSDADRG
ncbi:LacI family DNA-binding transcriptional regulator [Actinopolymorpha alba]|uniref:LacI family DNA-binding transcriptional regulator n=1 Tax=Actinopolymorpha alba TaxID=533267 RepID=UPI000382693F|nr:LacI family DNA-binding transcriptional regulator [Actinopolymorpha alba]